ncbi:MAG: OadG family transporter subunit [Treponema sp.]
MTISEMLGQSGLLTLLGMGVVFSFIIILIIFMQLLHILVRGLKLDKEPAKKTATIKNAGTAGSAAADTGSIIAAIAAAVRERQSQ